MRRRGRATPRRGALAHAFVAVAVAAPPAAGLGVVAASALAPGQSTAARSLLAALGVGFVALVTVVALLPVVRPAEVAVARALHGLPETALPDVARPESWASRRRGAGWLLVLGLVGAGVALALLALLPLGVGLVAHPWSGSPDLTWAGLRWRVGSGAAAWWTVLPGALGVLVALASVPVAGGLLGRWAPRLLGPTLEERVLAAARRERELARAHELARELHDSLGHRITGMTVQTTLARRLLTTAAPDLRAVDRALAAVEDLGRQAQADVDDVVGALRRSAPDHEPPRAGSAAADPVDVVGLLAPLLAEHGGVVEAAVPARLVLAAPTAHAVHGVAREALTNASRHGAGPTRLRLSRNADAVLLEVRNAVGHADDPAGAVPADAAARAGLRGAHERMLLVGGTLEAAPDARGEWLLRAWVPLGEVGR